MSKVNLQELRAYSKSMDKVLTVNVLDTFVQTLALSFLTASSTELEQYTDEMLDVAREDHDNGFVHADMEDQFKNDEIENQYIDIQFVISGFVNGTGDWQDQNINFTKIDFTFDDNSTWSFLNNAVIENEILKQINYNLYSPFPLVAVV